MIDSVYSEVEVRAREWRERMARAYGEWWRQNGAKCGCGAYSASGTTSNERKTVYDDYVFASNGMSDDYLVIGCSRNASFVELRRAYHRAAKRFHPDMLHVCSMSDEMARRASERMAKINAAWERVCASRGFRA